MKIPAIKRGLFPDVTILNSPARANTHTVRGASWINDQRKILANHNAMKNINLVKIDNEQKEAVRRYNVELEAARKRCKGAINVPNQNETDDN